jgi:hypothetical protein
MGLYLKTQSPLQAHPEKPVTIQRPVLTPPPPGNTAATALTAAPASPASPAPLPVSAPVSESATTALASTTTATQCPCAVEAINDLELPAPEFAPNLPETLTTNAAGEVYLGWTRVQGARSYLVTIEDAHGNVRKKIKASLNHVYLKDLPADPNHPEAEHHYKVRIASINLSSRVGVPSQAKSLTYKAQAALVPPQIKSIKVLE